MFGRYLKFAREIIHPNNIYLELLYFAVGLLNMQSSNALPTVILSQAVPIFCSEDSIYIYKCI